MGETPPADFQRSLGWSPGMLWNILYGERGAGRDTALLLFERHQIPIGAWAEKPTETFIPPAAREPEEEPSEGAA